MKWPWSHHCYYWGAALQPSSAVVWLRLAFTTGNPLGTQHTAPWVKVATRVSHHQGHCHSVFRAGSVLRRLELPIQNHSDVVYHPLSGVKDFLLMLGFWLLGSEHSPTLLWWWGDKARGAGNITFHLICSCCLSNVLRSSLLLLTDVTQYQISVWICLDIKGPWLVNTKRSPESTVVLSSRLLGWQTTILKHLKLPVGEASTQGFVIEPNKNTHYHFIVQKGISS